MCAARFPERPISIDHDDRAKIEGVRDELVCDPKRRISYDARTAGRGLLLLEEVDSALCARIVMQIGRNNLMAGIA